MKKKQAAKKLLQDINVKRWYENLSRGSKLNADIRLRRLNLFCYTVNITPAKLVSVGKKDVIIIENILLDQPLQESRFIIITLDLTCL